MDVDVDSDDAEVTEDVEDMDEVERVFFFVSNDNGSALSSTDALASAFIARNSSAVGLL